MTEKQLSEAMDDLERTAIESVRERDETVAALQSELSALKVENERLVDLLRRSLQLPRPWIDGGISWEKWDAIFSEIEAALDAK